MSRADILAMLTNIRDDIEARSDVPPREKAAIKAVCDTVLEAAIGTV